MKKALGRYLAGTFALTLLWDMLRIFRFSTGWQAGVLSFLAMWAPGICALMAGPDAGVFPMKKLRACRGRCLLAGVLLPVSYLAVSCAVYLLLTGTSFRLTGGRGPVRAGLEFLRVLGEELGWRGFLYPALKTQYDRRTALTAGGLIWTAYHLPLILGGLCHTETPLWYGLPVFTLLLCGMGAILAWLTERSESLWPAVAMHAAHNLGNRIVMRSICAGGAFFVGEQGILTAAAAVLTAVILYTGCRKKIF